MRTLSARAPSIEINQSKVSDVLLSVLQVLNPLRRYDKISAVRRQIKEEEGSAPPQPSCATRKAANSR